MTPFLPDAARMMRTQAFMTALATEAGAVIWMRMLGLCGAWSVAPSESATMIAEKQAAFARAGEAGLRASYRGQSPDAVLMATLAPIRRTTRANHARLTQSGPKTLR
ncbi:hypothetical protein [Pseudoponticoccus marisrubri]|uniref:Antifreeze protein n=1 Tax=Pseudoponticoccus marisrubri TaxID=1685382 RepID=A0A0W7WFN7_9RHOB|nr:hypothetical protein [Pseudoponticoccus marisrubri]KUF09378.1 hypothetical protein AVJ23_18215 [Pseudoponticoccus marisrubri]